jgi:hypothetical protein
VSTISPEADVDVTLFESEKKESTLRLKLAIKYNRIDGVTPRISSGLKAFSLTKFSEKQTTLAVISSKSRKKGLIVFTVAESLEGLVFFLS